MNVLNIHCLFKRMWSEILIPLEVCGVVLDYIILCSLMFLLLHTHKKRIHKNVWDRHRVQPQKWRQGRRNTFAATQWRRSWNLVWISCQEKQQRHLFREMPRTSVCPQTEWAKEEVRWFINQWVVTVCFLFPTHSQCGWILTMILIIFKAYWCTV